MQTDATRASRRGDDPCRGKQLLLDDLHRQPVGPGDDHGVEIARLVRSHCGANPKTVRGHHVAATGRDQDDVVGRTELVGLVQHLGGPADIEHGHAVEHEDPDPMCTCHGWLLLCPDLWLSRLSRHGA